MNKIYYILTATILMLFCANCSNEITTNDPGVSIDILIDSVESYGSINAFNKLETASFDHRPGTFLSTFLIMADKYKNADACMKVYQEIIWMYYIPDENEVFILGSLNTDARKMAIRYLLKADSLGNQEAKNIVLELKSNGIIK